MHGTGRLPGGDVEAMGDHRLAMLGAVAGLASMDGVLVQGFEAVGVSYPGFAARPGRAGGGGGVIVAIDGPAGAGKSTVARAVARGWAWPTSTPGRCTAALTWLALQRGVDPADGPSLAGLARDVPMAIEPTRPTATGCAWTGGT